MTKYVGLISLFHLTAIASSAEAAGVPKPIPGTSLKTGHYYSMYTSKFPEGFITWNNDTLDRVDCCDVKVYKDSQHFKVDEVNKEWAFLCATDEPDWYHLVNRGRPDEFLSWGKRKNSDGNTSYVLTLKFPTNGVADHYLFRPVRPTVNVDVDKYQLKLKSFPNAIIKWSDIDGSMFLEVAQPSVNYTKMKYEKYTPEFIDTLFVIKNDHGLIQTYYASSNRVSLSFSNLVSMAILVVVSYVISGIL